jgi:CheY-like chemotaxis protein
MRPDDPSEVLSSPVASNPVQSSPVQRSPVQNDQAPGSDVLVVEDDPDIRELLCEVLSEAGCRAESAVNGQDALEVLARRAPPRLILLDVMMPVMDGATFLARLRQVPEWLRVPVVVISASLQVPEADAVLRKPVDLEELMRTVSRFCELPRWGAVPA